MDDINLKNKRILITGGTGYLGKNLVSSLQDLGSDIFIIDQKKLGLINEFCIDISDKNEVVKVINEIQPQYIFHLAALLNRDRDFLLHDKIMQVNYFGTVNLLLALKEIKYDNFIFTSTSEVYGGDNVPYNETMLPMPASPYSLSKLYAENLIQTFSTINKKPYTILRLFNFFGKNMPNDFFIPQLLNSLKQEDSFKMTKGEQTRDFLYLDDVIQALMLALKNKKANNEIFNVCSGKSITLKDFALDCKNELKSSCRIDFGALEYRENEVWNMLGDNSKIKNMLGFEVNFDIKEMIKELVV